MLKEKNLRLRAIDESDLRFLFKLLKERDPNANISHKKMPTFLEHEQFVMSKPYSYWYVIELSQAKVGTIYLSKNNEIGIFLKKTYHGKGIGAKALKQLITKHPRKRYLANINPDNIISKEFFKNNKFKLIQHTYELEEEY